MPRLRPLSAWTLRAKLVAAVLALFTVVMLSTGLGVVLLTRDYLVQQQVNALTQSADRMPRLDRSRDEHPRDGDFAPPVGSGADLKLMLRDGAVGMTPGGTELNTVGNGGRLTGSQVALLSRVRVDGAPAEVDLGGSQGTYLVVARSQPDGWVLVSGSSTAGVDRAVGRLQLVTATATLLGLALVWLGGTLLVRRSLEPLDRVATTARRVSGLELDSGDVQLAERVPAADADPHTEVGQVGLALNRMLDNVESALKARQESELRVRQFVADASHELRTPLASIRGYAELSRREREPVPSGVTHAMSRVESEALRMQGLVEDLLLLARLDSGRPLEREPVDLTLLAMDAVSDAHAAAPSHVWTLDLPDEPVEVAGDRGRLHQILANLLANARSHTPEGTRVVTKISREGDRVRLSVNDNGPGVPDDLQGRVFERFTRGDDSRSRAAGSTGLGLSIVAAVGEAHGGSVELRSQPGDTTFSVLLPAG